MNDKPPVVLNPLAVDEHAAAAMLGISVRSFWEYRRTGEIPTIRIGRSVRFAVDDLRRFLDSKRQDSDFGQGESAESSD